MTNLIVTTSRKPCILSIVLAKDLSKSFPLSFYFSRGKKSIKLLLDEAVTKGEEFVLIVSEMHGSPNELRFIQIKENNFSYFAFIKIKSLKSRKQLTLFNSKIRVLSLKVENKQLGRLLKVIGINSVSGSVFSLIEENNVLSFFRDRKEIGPIIGIEGVVFE